VETNLEYPNAGGVEDWDSLYRARGDEVQTHRPVFTGDVFLKVRVQGIGQTKTKSIMIIQHPCALRTDGVNLHPRLPAAEVRTHPLISAEDWTKHISKMPLPELVPTAESGKRHQAAFFDELYLVDPEELDPAKRAACLSQTGVNLVLQRWVNHSSRVVVATWKYQEVSSAVYEEADLIEEWCEERTRPEATAQEATLEALKWLRADAGGGVTRQQLLENPQNRSGIRKEMRAALRALRTERV
jgi:hypothetical protein